MTKNDYQVNVLCFNVNTLSLDVLDSRGIVGDVPEAGTQRRLVELYMISKAITHRPAYRNSSLFFVAAKDMIHCQHSLREVAPGFSY